MLVPVLYTLVLDLLKRGLPGDTSLWSTILNNMHDFSNLLQYYFKSNFFYLQGPYPSQNADSSPSNLLYFNYPTNNSRGSSGTDVINFLIPDHFYHSDPVKKWTLL